MKQGADVGAILLAALVFGGAVAVLVVLANSFE